MNIQTSLDIEMVALERSEKITVMLDLTAPMNSVDRARPGQAVQVVLDRSGSMDGAPLDAAIAAIQALVSRLSPQDFFGLVAFDDTAMVIAPTRSMAEHDMPALRNAISNIAAGNSTDISAGYLMGIRELGRITCDGGSTLLLLSDGHANAGEVDPKFFSDVASKSAQGKVATATIGLGTGYDETLLEAMAQGGGGTHRFAASTDEAVAAISLEVNNLLDKCVVNTVLRITPDLSVAPTPPQVFVAQRLPHWKDGDSYLIQLGDLYGGENRKIIIDMVIPEIAKLGLCTIATLTFEYLNISAMQEISVSMPLTVNVVPGDQAAGRIPDPIVRAQRLVLSAQESKAEAAKELRSGDISGASARLTQSITSLESELLLLQGEDTRIVNSREIINIEVAEMKKLADIAKNEDQYHSSKRFMESFSKGSRSRNFREDQFSDDPDKDNS